MVAGQRPEGSGRRVSMLDMHMDMDVYICTYIPIYIYRNKYMYQVICAHNLSCNFIIQLPQNSEGPSWLNPQAPAKTSGFGSYLEN